MLRSCNDGKLVVDSFNLDDAASYFLAFVQAFLLPSHDPL